MKIILQQFRLTIVLSFLALYSWSFLGCKNINQGGAGSGGSSSTLPPTATVTPVGNGSVNDNLGFQIVAKAPPATSTGTSSGSGTGTGTSSGATAAATPSYTNIQTFQMTSSPAQDITSTCQISTNQTLKDIFCIAHAEEGDLYDNGMNLGLNIPTTMCNYMQFQPYYYWAMPPATLQGDKYSLHFDSNANMIGCTATSSSGTALTATFANNVCNITSAAGKQLTFNNQTAVCSSDYAAVNGDSTQPNCCEGTYTLTVTTDAQAPNPPSVTVTTNTYPGKMVNCLRGPATMNNWPTDKNGKPEYKILNIANQGASFEYDIPAPISVQSYTNILVSNMIGWTQYQAGTLPGLLPNLSSLGNYAAFMPTAFNFNYYAPTNKDLFGHLITPVAQPFYDFQCLDQGFEVINRIRLFVASWSTAAEYNKFVTTGTGNLDIPPPGSEITNCTGVAPQYRCSNWGNWIEFPVTTYPGFPY